MDNPRAVPPQRTRATLRAVGAIRLSKFTDASTSPEVQEEMITNTCDRIGGTFVGWARDTDVSALKTTPWERAELAPWLNSPELWDVMIWQRLDRAVRSMADMADLGRFAKQHKKRLIFSAGPGGDMLELDFSSSMSELILLILAFAAQLEGQTIMERNQGAAAHLRSIGRYSGGTIPYGYHLVRKVFSDGREGWWLGLHEETAAIRRAAIARTIAGHGATRVLRWLVESEAITPKNHQARLVTPPREHDDGDTWRLNTVYDMLRSPIVRGYQVRRDGSMTRTTDGSPVIHAEPMIDDETWYQLESALKELAVPSAHPRRKDGHELLGVIVCGTCERNMYGAWNSFSGVRKGTFRCHGGLHEKDQPASSILRTVALEYVDEQFVDQFGPFRRTQVIRTAGVDHTAEINELEDDLQELSGRLVRLRGAAADVVEQQIQGISDRLGPLKERPVVPSREQTVELDTTWGEAWQQTDDWAVRRRMLNDLGVKVKVMPGNRWTPRDDRLSFAAGTHVDPEQDALDDIAQQESF
ncbi:recombinase family protein [Streptomyces sp. H27-H1]|uniref:recombinase family protein n=1 Tax=Streptomyces sp. H27-H1 TaxID=2996461 RepID=UPI00226EAAC4|nr:recombinase family protein [Streptomyces sp. H27-H1]MCY0926201.1 recombinase family protein [Streptomyces sp. H27-H1]